MKILIGCEFSGVVRDAFAALGHDAWSCDVLPTEITGQHIEGDVRDYLDAGWDMAIFHPPCTHLAVSGARWFKGKADEQAHGLGFVMQLAAAPIDRIAIENPISILSSRWRKPDQIIQPWQFGHGEVKATCLWLKGLPPLAPTDVVDGRVARVHTAPPLSGPLERTQPDSERHCRSDGLAVGSGWRQEKTTNGGGMNAHRLPQTGGQS